MLCRGEQDALLHQAGGVTDARNIAAMSLDFEIVEIRAAEDNARVGWRGDQPEVAGNCRVKTNSDRFDGALDGRLASHELGVGCI